MPADLREGEEEELTVLYRKFQHGQKIMEGLSAADRALSSESISVALKEVDRVAEFDEALGPIRDQLYDADSIIRDIIHDVSSYIDSFSFDEEEYERIGERLDVIHGLQAKYGDDISDIMVQLEEKRKRLEELENRRDELENRLACEKLAKPKVSAEFMTFWLHRFRKLDVRQQSHRKMLIDTFINAIFLYDDKMVITFNYKEGTKTITFAELQEAISDKNGSDLDCLVAPEKVP